MSNLFMRIFSQHPQIVQTDYMFMSATMHGPEALMVKSSTIKLLEDEQTLREKFKDEYFQRAFEKLHLFFEKSEWQVRVIQPLSSKTLNTHG
jgi:hypothetical protein